MVSNIILYFLLIYHIEDDTRYIKGCEIVEEKVISMPTVTRRIFCYNVVNQGKISFKKVLDDYNSKLNSDYIDLEKRDLIFTKDSFKFFLDIHSIDKYYDHDNINMGYEIYNCIIYKLRDKDFPYLFNLMSGSKTKLKVGKNDSLMEQTHFIVIPKLNLLLMENNHFGPSINLLPPIISKALGVHYISDLKITPIFNVKTVDKIRRLKNIKSIRLRAGHQGLKTISKYIGIGLLDTTEETFDSDTELMFDLVIKGKGRYKNINNKENNLLVEKMLELKTYLDSHILKKAKTDIEKVQIEEIGSKYPIDLLEEFLVSEVTVCKLDEKYKYLDSNSMFKSIFLMYNDNVLELDKFKLLKYDKSIYSNSNFVPKNTNVNSDKPSMKTATTAL